MSVWSVLQDLLSWPRETFVNKPRHRKYIADQRSYSYTAVHPVKGRVKVYDPDYVQYKDDVHYSTEPRVNYPNYGLYQPKPRFVGAEQAIKKLKKIIMNDPTMQALIMTASDDQEASEIFNRRLEELLNKTAELPGSAAAFVDKETVQSQRGKYNPDMATAISEIEQKILAEEKKQREQEQQKRIQQNDEAERRRAVELQRVQDKYIQDQRPEVTLDNSVVVGGPALTGEIWDEVKLALTASQYTYLPTAPAPPPIDRAVPIYDMTAHPPVIDGIVGWCARRNTIIIAFKGTDSVRDAKTDANAFTTDNISEINGRDLVVPLEGHSGFIYRFLNLFPQVLEDVNAALQGGDPEPHRTKLLITGHSLGGALATVAAIVFAQFYPELPIQLITFEAPRSVTTNTLSRLLGYLPTQKMEQNAIRISCKEDPVPNLPTQNAGYSHVGRSYYITRKDGGSFDQHRLATVRRYLEWYGVMGELDKKSYMPLTNGRGKVSSKKGTEEMRKRMAYVRSFRKSKMK